MAEMSPEQMQAMQGAAAQEEGPADPQDGDQQGGGDIVAKVQSVGAGLAELGDILDKAQGTTDQDREEMSQCISLFSGLVQRKLGGGEAEAEGPMPADQGMASAMGGAKGVPMGPQGRM